MDWGSFLFVLSNVELIISEHNLFLPSSVLQRASSANWPDLPLGAFPLHQTPHTLQKVSATKSVSLCSGSPLWLLVCLEIKEKEKESPPGRSIRVQPSQAPPAVMSEISSSYEQTFQGVSKKQEKKKQFALPASSKISSLRSPEIPTDYSC